VEADVFQCHNVVDETPRLVEHTIGAPRKVSVN
jgi:hypothetical protein